MSSAPYDLRQLPQAREQIKKLGKQAVQKGLKPIYVNALKLILQKLQSNPQESGDPVYRLHKVGGLMYQGVFGPLFVQYAVFEQERIVLISRVIPMPNSALDSP
jgi:hypothetical protein